MVSFSVGVRNHAGPEQSLAVVIEVASLVSVGCSPDMSNPRARSPPQAQQHDYVIGILGIAIADR